MKTSTKRLLYCGLLGLLALAMTQSRQPTHLESIIARGEIRLVTRQGPITYYHDAKGENGFEYLLARDFADSLGVKLRVVTTPSLSQVFNMLGGPNADFAGATLTITPERLRQYRFSRPYAEVVQTVIFRRDASRPTEVEDLVGKQLAVISDSSHEENLRSLKQRHPGLTWLSIDGVEMIELIEMVEAGEVDYAIVDSTTYEAHGTMYTRTARAMDISKPQQLAWVFPAHTDKTFLRAANRFLERAENSGRLDELKEEFFEDIENFSVAGSQLFMRRMQNRLPRFQDLFEEVAGELEMDWHFLAAIAYQESHWDPNAVSPTGVRGMMMLTRKAASEVEVDNRRDPEQSIRGGARYFLRTREKLPDDILEPDRTWFALAAYNVGLGHLEDARVLTDRAGRNPHLWEDVREFLPLLQRKKYYTTVRHGYARGKEPVVYVRNVIKYFQLLQWNTVEESRRSQRRQRDESAPAPNWNPDSFKTL